MTWKGALPRDRPLGFPGAEPQLGAGFGGEMRENTTASPRDSTTELDMGGGVECGHSGRGKEVLDLPSGCLETNMRKVGGSGIREAPATVMEG